MAIFNSIKEIEDCVKAAFCHLSIEPLFELDENANYSFQTKDEFISNLESLFNKIRATGIDKLNVETSKCKFRYPNSNAYSFHNPKTGDFVIRYVFAQEKDGIYRVEECKNRPIADGEYGLPF